MGAAVEDGVSRGGRAVMASVRGRSAVADPPRGHLTAPSWCCPLLSLRPTFSSIRGRWATEWGLVPVVSKQECKRVPRTGLPGRFPERPRPSSNTQAWAAEGPAPSSFLGCGPTTRCGQYLPRSVHLLKRFLSQRRLLAIDHFPPREEGHCHPLLRGGETNRRALLPTHKSPPV